MHRSAVAAALTTLSAGFLATGVWLFDRDWARAVAVLTSSATVLASLWLLVLLLRWRPTGLPLETRPPSDQIERTAAPPALRKLDDPLDNKAWLRLVEECVDLFDELDRHSSSFDAPRREVVEHVSSRLREILERCGGEVVEQVIRPTGLVDPLLHVRPARGQVPDLIEEIKKRAAKSERVLVTTLTKRLAEDLSAYLRDAGLRGKWLHSELDAIERVQILRELREGAFDVLVGVNLLREGLDLPEVSLVAILDADKEGFLRSGTSLIQTIGRAARNVNAEVILYADKVTDSMQRAIEETQRRRALQLEYNASNDITPQTVRTAIGAGIEEEIAARQFVQEVVGQSADNYVTQEYLEELHAEMLAAAANLEFERAAQLRDRIAELKGQPVAAPQLKKRRGRRR